VKYRVVFSDGVKELGLEVEADSMDEAKGIAWDAAKEIEAKSGKTFRVVRVIAL
jgi:hypothetical protein